MGFQEITVSNLLVYEQEIRNALVPNKSQVGSIYSDFGKAFAVVDHGI